MNNKKFFSAGLVASSPSGGDDGKYQMYSSATSGTYPKLSSDYGSSFSNIYNTAGWRGIAVSGDGKYIVITQNSTGGTSYLSSDFGASFSSISDFGSTRGYDVEISETGQYMIAGMDNGVYVSSNYGANWTRKSTSYSTGCSISSTGEYMFYVLRDNKIYYSYDYGSTFTANTNFGNRTWNSVATTETQGHYIAGDLQFLWKTTDNGATNTKILTGMGDEVKCAISGDGQYISAGSKNFSSSSPGQRLFYSSDGGASFGSHRVIGYAVIDVAMSLSGQYQLSIWKNISGQYNQVYISDDYGSTITRIGINSEFLVSYVSRSTQ